MMNNSGTEIDRWLIEGTLETGQELDSKVWLANFDVDRQVVFSKFGAYRKLFLRQEKFIKRFYHTLYPLLVEDWLLSDVFQFFEGFCTINIQLDIRFQATFAYAQSQQEILSEINEHIKSTYHASIMDLINNQLLNLQDDSWVRTGLEDIEQSIEIAVSEMLVLENIQSQSVCKVKAFFAEFPDVQLDKERIYLSVLKKNYEVTEQNREEVFHQLQQEQKQKLDHKQKQLENFENFAELERVKQAQEAEHQKKLLIEQERQQQEQFEIETRLYEAKVQHENRFKQISLQTELEQKQSQSEQLLMVEQQIQAEKITHQALLKKQEIDADIEKYEQKQIKWLNAKAKKNELQLQHEYRQEQMKFEMQANHKKRLEEERMEMQEQNYKITKNSDIYLRREIELLELDKKRLALQLEIQDSKVS